jgi:hypothetical protein
MLNINKIVSEFDEYISKLGLSFEGVVIGGAALNLLGVVSRLTRDCDVLDPQIPADILDASVEFAKEQRTLGNLDITEKWFNNGPSSLKRHLPKGWESRLVPVFSGKAIIFRGLGRADLLKTKLYAQSDRQDDLDDCVALKPTLEELKDSLEWVQFQDANPTWPDHVQNIFKEVAEALGYEF